MRLAAMLLPAVLLPAGGCAYHDARLAATAETSLVGLSVADLDMCAGLPTKSERIDGQTEMRSYERNVSTNSGVNITFPVIGGGANIGNGGYCHATFKLVDGQVAALSYAGDTAVAGADDAVCAPIVRTCVERQAEHPDAARAVASRR
ncbi:MAG: hypothetical protein WDN25_02940 [Acetobacteraceae bacterium]